MKQYLVIGGVAGGMSAAARLRRLDPSAAITVLEMGGEVSFANCGLPYHVSGEIADRSKLLLRTPEQLAQTLRLDVRTRTRATAIDPQERVVTATGPDGEEQFGYDALVLAPGAEAFRPPVEGLDHPLVHTLRDVPDADALRALVTGGARRAVVLGAGFIGLEAVEGLRRVGLEVTLVEAAPQVLPVVDPEIAVLVRRELEANGVRVFEGVAAQRIHGDAREAVVDLSNGEQVSADLVVLSVGVRPRVELARSAGLELTENRAILVDEHQRTSDPHIWAVGDATASVHAVTGAVAPVALATPANRGGRVAADDIAGRGGRPSPRPLGTAVVRVFDLTVAMTGAPRRSLADRQFHTARVHAGDHAGYYPGAQTMHLLLHFAPDGQILGAQGAGKSGVDKRIDVIATAVRGGLGAPDLVDLDLCYAPPFGAAKDPVLMLGMIADNILADRLNNWDAVAEGIDDGLLIDVRNPEEYQKAHVEGAVLIPQPQIAERLEEIREMADGRKVKVYCASGFRSYLASRTLNGAGIPAASLSGGFKTWDLTH